MGGAVDVSWLWGQVQFALGPYTGVIRSWAQHGQTQAASIVQGKQQMKRVRPRLSLCVLFRAVIRPAR
jgi:hypothetical protein